MGDVAKGIKSFKKGMSDDVTANSQEDNSKSDTLIEKQIINMPQIGWLEILSIVIIAIWF